MCRDCEECLGGWLLRRALECQIYVSRLRRTPQGGAASASPRVPSYVSRLRRTPRGWLLWRAPECQVYVSRLRRMPWGVAASASPRVPSYVSPLRRMPRGLVVWASSRVPSLCVAIAKNASGGG